MRVAILFISALLLGACATQLEQQSTAEFSRRGRTPAASESAATPSGRPEGARTLDGSLDGYLAYAVESSPTLRVQYFEWQAAVERIPQARRLPEPVLTYGYFVRNVETRVGPQRHRFGISQSFPWPTKLTAGADAASVAARAVQQQYEAVALEVNGRVADAYWKLWMIERAVDVQQEQRRILEQFSAIVRSRLEVGQATLADLGQVDLSVSRIVDALAGLEEQRTAASAALVAAIGAPPGTATPVDKAEPAVVVPAEGEEDLRRAASDHPRVKVPGLMAEARAERAVAANADRYPSFTLGLDYIETGEAVMPAEDSGKDAIVVMLGAKLPLWGGVYGAQVAEARAESAAFRARQQAARDMAGAQVEKAMSDVRDAARRALLYRNTLVPQAQSVFSSVLGSYQVGKATLAATLLAQRDLLELQLGLYRAEADLAMAWARLEETVGRQVRPRSAT